MVDGQTASAARNADDQYDIGIEGSVVLDTSGEARRANVYLRDGRVAEVTAEQRRSQYTLQRPRAIVMPGFVNLHLHTRPGRALGDGLPLAEWHTRWADGISSRMQAGDAYAGAALALSECLLGGTTAVVIMTPNYLEAAQAARDLGIRAVVVPLAVDDPAAIGTGDDLRASIATITALGAQRGQRVRVWLGFDGTATTSEAGMRAVAEAARAIPVGVHTHLSEDERGARTPYGARGLAGARYFAECGLLNLPESVLLAHCNWLDEDEVELLAASPAVVVAHNPTSNMRLGVGICPVQRLARAGVRIGLGTDGMLSNFHLDVFQVMRAACMLQRIAALDAGALGSAAVFAMATRGGELFGAQSGEIVAGARADLAILDPRGPHFAPRIDVGESSNLLALVVWCAGPADVRDVIVDGRLVVEDRTLLTAQSLQIEQRAQQVLERMLHASDECSPER